MDSITVLQSKPPTIKTQLCNIDSRFTMRPSTCRSSSEWLLVHRKTSCHTYNGSSPCLEPLKSIRKPNTPFETLPFMKASCSTRLVLENARFCFFSATKSAFSLAMYRPVSHNLDMHFGSFTIFISIELVIKPILTTYGKYSTSSRSWPMVLQLAVSPVRWQAVSFWHHCSNKRALLTLVTFECKYMHYMCPHNMFPGFLSSVLLLRFLHHHHPQQPSHYGLPSGVRIISVWKCDNENMNTCTCISTIDFLQHVNLIRPLS